MTTERGATSPQMETIIRQLATVYNVDLSQRGASFALELPSRSHRWLITHLEGTRVSVTRCVIEEGDCLGLELDMLFRVHPLGWEPVEIVYTTPLWEEYLQAAEAASLAIYQTNGELCFASFAEYWAHQLQQQGWLTQARKVEEVEWPDEPADARLVRLAGCQGAHPGSCYGELWQCAACGKTVCYAEGSDNHPELCDDCWCQHYGSQEDDVPYSSQQWVPIS